MKLWSISNGSHWLGPNRRCQSSSWVIPFIPPCGWTCPLSLGACQPPPSDSRTIFSFPIDACLSWLCTFVFSSAFLGALSCRSFWCPTGQLSNIAQSASRYCLQSWSLQTWSGAPGAVPGSIWRGLLKCCWPNHIIILCIYIHLFIFIRWHGSRARSRGRGLLCCSVGKCELLVPYWLAFVIILWAYCFLYCIFVSTWPGWLQRFESRYRWTAFPCSSHGFSYGCKFHLLSHYPLVSRLILSVHFDLYHLSDNLATNHHHHSLHWFHFDNFYHH